VTLALQRLQLGAERVLAVLRGGDVLEVFSAVIALDSIDVIDLVAALAFTDEGRGDERVRRRAPR
jgi:hypothetical protein